MFGDERASAKEINLFFYVTSGTGLRGFRDNETGDARAHVQSLHLRLLQTLSLLGLKPAYNFVTIGQSVLEIRRWGVHVRTCRSTQLNDLYKVLR